MFKLAYPTPDVGVYFVLLKEFYEHDKLKFPVDRDLLFLPSNVVDPFLMCVVVGVKRGLSMICSILCSNALLERCLSTCLY